MKSSSRALAAVLLLAGFPVLVLLVIGAIVATEILVAGHSIAITAKLAIIGVPVVYALLRALFVIERGRDDELPGLPVTPAQQPELWALVRELAERVGTPPPAEIALIPQVNAAVMERTRWLGLRVAGRRMFIGAPLLAGLRHDELSAVLGHELGHYGNRDTRFAALTYRGRVSVIRALTGLRGKGFEGLVRRLFVLYAKLYFSVSAGVCRHQELAADAAAARIAGTESAMNALRKVDHLAAGWQFYLGQYVSIGWKAGYLPAELSAGFRALLADETRSRELQEAVASQPEESSRYDSHPPTERRIAALKELPPVPSPPGGDRPASDLLRDPTATLDAAMASDLSDEARRKQRTDWVTLADIGGRQRYAESAASILRDAKLDGWLDLLDAGRAEELSTAKIPATAGARARTELISSSVRKRLSTVVTAALAAAGVAHFTLSWSHPSKLVFDEPYRDELPGALDQAVAGETGSLRALLTKAGVPAGYHPTRP